MRNALTRGAFLGLFAVLVALAGCGRRIEPQAVQPQPPQWLVVGVSLCKTDSPWRAQMQTDIEAAAEKHPNLRLAVMDAQDDTDRQRAQLEEFLARRVALVIVSPKNAQAITGPVAKLFDAGIPVIVLDRAVIGDKYTCLIAADPKQIGSEAGKWLAERLQGKGKIVDLKGPVDSLPAEELDAAFRAAFRDPGYRFVFDGHVDPPKVDGGKLMTEALARVEKIDAVFAYDDAAAHAAYLAAKAAGREKDVLFVGVGGMPAEGAGVRGRGHARRHVSLSHRRGRGHRRRGPASPKPAGSEEDRAHDAGNHQRDLSGKAMSESQNPSSGPAPHSAREPAVWGVSIGDYLIRRLQDFGVRDVFGIPGDYILAFYAMLEKSPIQLIGCTREDCAGFAADAYARLNGIGAVCVTYCVGGLSLCNSIAGAYAEKSPVVVISGSPGLRERFNNPLLHHRVQGLPHAGRGVPPPLLRRGGVERPAHGLAAKSTACWRPWSATGGRATSSCRATWSTSCPTARTRPPARSPPAIPESLAEAVGEAVRRISASQRPVIIAGVEIHRFGLQDELLQFAEGAGIPITATMLGKSVVSERHPLFAGIYEGALGREEVTPLRRGERLRDPAGRVHDRHQHGHFHGQSRPGPLHLRHQRSAAHQPSPLQRRAAGRFHPRAGRRRPEGPAAETAAAPRRRPSEPFQLRPSDPITIRRLIARLNQALDDTMVVIADIRATPCSPPASW